MILNGDSDGDAFLAGLDKKTGETVWKTPRPNRVRSFSTPLFIEVNERPQMVLAGSKSVAGFDPHTGKQLWVADSPTDKFVATVAYADGVIFATGTSPNHTLVGIRPDGTGNVTKSHVLWTDTRGAAYVPSPLGFGKHVFVLSDAGIGTLLEAKTGKRVWSERLGGRLHHASPLLINDLDLLPGRRRADVRAEGRAPSSMWSRRTPSARSVTPRRPWRTGSCSSVRRDTCGASESEAHRPDAGTIESD